MIEKSFCNEVFKETHNMNIQKISHFDTANGKGIRTVVWVSGCCHGCEGCHNPQTWDENSGRPLTINDIEDIGNSLDMPYVHGVTFSGGDPLLKKNRPMITALAKSIKRCYPDKTIWCYTGYDYEDLQDEEILNYIDVLVDGRFEIDKRDITLKFRGSSNQRIIDVQETLKQNKVVLYNLD